MNPVSEIKSNLSVSKIIGFVVLALVVFAIADATGLGAYIFQPYTTIKNKFFNKGA